MLPIAQIHVDRIIVLFVLNGILYPNNEAISQAPFDINIKEKIVPRLNGFQELCSKFISATRQAILLGIETSRIPLTGIRM